MIPYLEWRVIQAGPVVLQVWGLFAAFGVILGYWYAMRQARKLGLDASKFDTLVFRIVVWSFIGARLGHILFYEPGYYFDNPAEILKVWRGGLSSFGGFLGAAIAFFFTLRRKTLPILPSADALVKALPLALGCGRIGCFLIHDHPGTLAHGAGKWLAVNYPDGARFDLGLLLGVFDFVLFGFFILLARKQRPDGYFFMLFMTVYGPARFALDFLRETDARYFGLTPAQYGSLALFALGLHLYASRIHRPRLRNS